MGASETKIYYDVRSHPSGLVKTKYVNGEKEIENYYLGVEKNRVFFNDKDWKEIKTVGHKDLDYCILDNKTNGIQECMGLFNKSDLDQFAVTKGPVKCLSYAARPGIVFKHPDEKELRDLGGITEGYLCRLVYQDFNYNDSEMNRCCFTTNKTRCNANLTNSFTTSHCNISMKELCKGKEESPQCILWLENNYTRKENMALEYYADFCSKNHESKACDYFCKVSRENNDYRSVYCDRALKAYCEKNPFKSNCHCVATPGDIVPEVETFLGPKECWLSACASQNDSKWLYTTQLETRRNCNITSCVISIDKLTISDDAKVEMINDCISGSSQNSSIKRKTINNKRTPGVLFSPTVALSLLAFILISTQR